MKPFIESAAIVTACGSATFWFLSAMHSMRSIKPGIGDLDKVNELSHRLQKVSRSNFWVAGLMGVTALLSAWIRFLG